MVSGGACGRVRARTINHATLTTVMGPHDCVFACVRACLRFGGAYACICVHEVCICVHVCGWGEHMRAYARQVGGCTCGRAVHRRAYGD